MGKFKNYYFMSIILLIEFIISIFHASINQKVYASINYEKGSNNTKYRITAFFNNYKNIKNENTSNEVCTAGLNHPNYSSELEKCPICALVDGVHVTNQTHVYDGTDHRVKYTNVYQAELKEYYDGTQIPPNKVKEYNFELKIIYEGQEYRTGITGKYAITNKKIIINGIDATDREYNKKKEVELHGGNLVGIEDGDTVNFILQTTGISQSEKVGTWFVTIPNIELTGEDASNYELVQPRKEDINVEITKRKVTVDDLDAVDRKYDKTKNVEVQGSHLDRKIDGDDVSAKVPKTGIADNTDIGEWDVTLDNIELKGADASNYEIIQPEKGDVRVNISKPAEPLMKVSSSVAMINDKEWTSDALNEVPTVRYGDIIRIKINVVNKGDGAGYIENIKVNTNDCFELIDNNEESIKHGWKKSIENNQYETNIYSFNNGEENELNKEESREAEIVLKVTKDNFLEVNHFIDFEIEQTDIRKEKIEYRENENNKSKLEFNIAYTDLVGEISVKEIIDANTGEKLPVYTDNDMTCFKVKNTDSNIKIVYDVKVTNNGKSEGSADKVYIYLPTDIEFEDENNSNWIREDKSNLVYSEEYSNIKENSSKSEEFAILWNIKDKDINEKITKMLILSSDDIDQRKIHGVAYEKLNIDNVNMEKIEKTNNVNSISLKNAGLVEETNSTLTLVYYLQNANNDEYAMIGTANMKNIDIDKNIKEIPEINNTINTEFSNLIGNDKAKYFKYNEEKTSPELEENVEYKGNKIVNIYFDRKKYKIKYIGAERMKNTDDKYQIYVKKENSNDYTFEEVEDKLKLKVGSTEYDNEYEYTAKYGEYVEPVYPYVMPPETNDSCKYEFMGWKTEDSSKYTEEYTKGNMIEEYDILDENLILDADDTEKVHEFYAVWTDKPIYYTYHYMLENLDTDNNIPFIEGKDTKEYNGKFYTEYNSEGVISNKITENVNTNNDILGYNKIYYKIDIRKGDTKQGLEENDPIDVYIYYDRKEYELNIYNMEDKYIPTELDTEYNNKGIHLHNENGEKKIIVKYATDLSILNELKEKWTIDENNKFKYPYELKKNQYVEFDNWHLSPDMISDVEFNKFTYTNYENGVINIYANWIIHDVH